MTGPGGRDCFSVMIRLCCSPSGRPIQDTLDFSGEERKVANIFVQQLQCERIINGPVPVYDNIPEPPHTKRGEVSDPKLFICIMCII